MNAQEYLSFLRQCTRANTTVDADIQEARRRYGRIRAEQSGDAEFTALYDGLAAADSDEFQTKYVTEHLLPYLLPVLPPETKEKLASVPIGVLSARSVNACAAKSPRGDPLIIIDTGLFSMLSFYLETKPTMFAIMQAEGPDAVNDYVSRAYRFVINYYEQSGQLEFPEPARGVKIPTEHLFILASQLMAVELFIIGHEVGHIHAGHLDARKTNRASVSPGLSGETEFYQPSWTQEYEADALGWQWYQQAWRKHPMLSHLGAEGAAIIPFYLFEYVALVEANTDRHSPYSTHPPATHRIAYLLKRVAATESKSVLEAAIEEARIAVNMPVLQRNTRPTKEP